MTAPFNCRFDGGVFVPLGRYAADCAATMVDGQIYRLEVREDRSEALHRFYFASINEAHANLPDHLAKRFPDPEMLRKYALIRTGYATQQQTVCASNAEALRLVAIVSSLDKYAVCDVDRNVVTIWRAESQSFRAMGKKCFHESQDRVLSYIAEMIGVNPHELGKAAA